MTRPRSRAVAAVLALASAAALAGCSMPPASPAPAADAPAGAALWDDSVVHDIAVEADEAELREAVEAYLDSGEKAWIAVDVVIDGARFEDVGLKLKGNSSLRGVTADDDPATLPWVIRLDKYVDGQDLDGWAELVVRGNDSATSLNEAVALGLLRESGLAAEAAVASAFSVNGGQAQLRLVVQNPDDRWAEAELGAGTLLYKAESGGTWDYVGEDPADYAASFDQEAGEDDLAPLIEFLRFLDESDDAAFAAELPGRLDVTAFAAYLAFQDLVGNTDDIDGPGNNSYLAYDPGTGMMTVVTWDLNLAFGGMPGGAGGGPGGMAGMSAGPGGAGARPAFPDGTAPGDGLSGADEGAGPGRGLPGATDGDVPNGGVPGLPDGAAPDGGFPGGAAPGFGGPGGVSQGNALAERFRADEGFAALIEDAAARLHAELVDSGVAAEILSRWETTLIEQGAGLVPADTVRDEAAAIASALGLP